MNELREKYKNKGYLSIEDWNTLEELEFQYEFRRFKIISVVIGLLISIYYLC